MRWYAAGFELGARGASPRSRRGRPRLSAMLPHWRRGLSDGAFARSMYVGAYLAALVKEAPNGRHVR